MSYRNDHDAALLRVDALETELETLRLAYERERAREEADKPPSKRKSRAAWVAAAGVLALTAGTAVGAVMLFHSPTPAPTPVVAVTAGPVFDDHALLRQCRDAIAKLPGKRDATTTDPRGLRTSVAPIVTTGATCRPLLANADKLAIDPELRALVAKWSRAEDELVGSITRTVIYYESDPYAADGYTSAQQLWKEYDRAVTVRDAVLDKLAPAL